MCTLRAALSQAARENETLQESVTTAAGAISELATLICASNESAQAAFLQNCMSSARSAQPQCGDSCQASCEGSEAGKGQGAANPGMEGGQEYNHLRQAASSSAVDIGAAARELAAMMLLRYRFLEAEKQQATYELEQQLHSALHQVRTGQQELAACYEQVRCCNHPIHHSPALCCPKSRPGLDPTLCVVLGRWRSSLRSRGERTNMKNSCAQG